MYLLQSTQIKLLKQNVFWRLRIVLIGQKEDIKPAVIRNDMIKGTVKPKNAFQGDKPHGFIIKT